MKDPYQYERNKAKARELSDTFEREPLDFHTEEERNRMAAEIEQRRIAELEQVRATRRQLLADKEAGKEAGKQALIRRHERWLAAWHIGLLIGGILALAKIVAALIDNGL
jgi:chemotaxis response regulator CheB